MIKLAAFADEIDKSLAVQIKVLKENGIPFIELRSVDGINVGNFTANQAKEYGEIISSAGLAVWSIGSPLGKIDLLTPFDEIETQVRKTCEIAKIFNTDKIRMFSFYNAYGDESKVLRYLNKMVEIAAEYDVRLYHENEKDIFGDTLERVLRIMQGVNGMKFIYDPANFIQVGENADDTQSALLDKIDYFHVKDVIKSTGEVVPAGYGDGKIDKLLDKIAGDTVLTLEPHLTVFSGYSDIDKTEMKNKFQFKNGIEAFNFAVKSLKELLEKGGYREVNGGYEKCK